MSQADEPEMDDDEDRGMAESLPAPALFKKRNKARTGLVSSSSRTGSPAPPPVRKSLLQSNEDEDMEADSGSAPAVLRTAGLRRRGRGAALAAGHEQKRSTGISFGVTGETEGEGGSAFPTRKNIVARPIDDQTSAQSLDLPMQRATIGESAAPAYSAAALAALKAATPSRRREVGDIEQDGDLQAAHKSMADPSGMTDESGESFTRMKFAADFVHDGIPSEAVINAAKERRRRAAASESTVSENYISLAHPHGQGPHPESRLPREEDEEGSGEEEFAEFTGATQRVALEKEAIEREKMQERELRRETMELDDSDGSEREWERAQMRRVHVPSDERKRREAREPSPFRPAPIPRTTSLPTLTSTSSRLQSKLLSLEEAVKMQEELQKDTASKLEQLRHDEARNKTDTEAAADREAWFREFEEFILSMAHFLEEKVPRLEEIETDWIGHLVVRTRMVQKARADALTDQLALFYGVASCPLIPVATESGINNDTPRPPIEDGDALSDFRYARRATATASFAGLLAPADQAAFEFAQKEILRRAEQLLDDVQAAEYREPAPRLVRGDGEHASLHPSSLVARFHRWRRMYPDDYHNAWGGLTLASVWDFWIRRTLCGWDALRLNMQQPRSVNEFSWYVELAHYSEKALQQSHKVHDTHGQDGKSLEHREKEEAAEEEQEGVPALGGDDEVVSHAFTNTLIPILIKICEKGGFDPWSPHDNSSALEVVEQMSYVLEKDNLRFQVRKK